MLHILQVHPQWMVIQFFIVQSLQQALRFDAQPTTHPMTYYVESPIDVENIFDKISYEKGKQNFFDVL